MSSIPWVDLLRPLQAPICDLLSSAATLCRSMSAQCTRAEAHSGVLRSLSSEVEGLRQALMILSERSCARPSPTPSPANSTNDQADGSRAPKYCPLCKRGVATLSELGWHIMTDCQSVSSGESGSRPDRVPDIPDPDTSDRAH